jgi:hypothetical protein
MQQYSGDLRRKLIQAWQRWGGSQQELTSVRDKQGSRQARAVYPMVTETILSKEPRHGHCNFVLRSGRLL